MSRYRPGKSARKMYRHKDRYGTAGMSRKQLKALAREMDIGVNPHKGRARAKARIWSRYRRAYGRATSRPYDKAPAGHRWNERVNKLGRLASRTGAGQAALRAKWRRSNQRRNPKGHRGHRSKSRSTHRRAYHLLDSEGDRVRSSFRDSRRDRSATRSRRRAIRRESPRDRDTRRYDEMDDRAFAQEQLNREYHNPYKGRYYSGRKSTRSAWNPRRGRNPFDGLHEDVVENVIGGMMNPRRSRRGRRNPVLTNPKRDGSQTKGEKRLQKHAEWLRTIADRGRQATAALKAMRSVPTASHVAAQEHAADKVSATVIAKALDGEPAAVEKVADVVEHAEAKFLRQQLADLTMLINSTKEEAESLGEQDEGMAEELMEQVTKMSKQRAALKAKAAGLGIQTNPRRRSRSVLVGTKRYAKALSALRAAIRHRPR